MVSPDHKKQPNPLPSAHLTSILWCQTARSHEFRSSKDVLKNGGAILQMPKVELHPRKTNGWLPKMMAWKRWLLLNVAILGIYVKFLGCISMVKTVKTVKIGGFLRKHVISVIFLVEKRKPLTKDFYKDLWIYSRLINYQIEWLQYIIQIYWMKNRIVWLEMFKMTLWKLIFDFQLDTNQNHFRDAGKNAPTASSKPLPFKVLLLQWPGIGALGGVTRITLTMVFTFCRWGSVEFEI